MKPLIKLAKNTTGSSITTTAAELIAKDLRHIWHPGYPLAPGTDRDNPNTAVKLV